MTISKNKTSLYPVINPKLCTVCLECVHICHTKAIIKTTEASCAKCIKYCMYMHAACKTEHLVFCYDLCDACEECVNKCKDNAIDWVDYSKIVNKNTSNKSY